MSEERKILDSGERRQFASGAVRDIQEGKGRYDLLPPCERRGEWMTYKEIIEIKTKVPKDDSKTVIVMAPTVNRAIYEWKVFQSRWSSIIKRTNKATLCTELVNGNKIFFKAETQGQQALLGCNAYIIDIDTFAGPQESEDKG